MTNVLPLRMNLLRLLGQGRGSRTGRELLEELKRDYGSERQCSRPVILDHLFNLASLGLVETANERLDADRNLELDFSLTPEGRKRAKYYPLAWRF